MAAPKHARMAVMLKQSILLAIASGFLTSLCPVFADTNDKSRLVDQATMINASHNDFIGRYKNQKKQLNNLISAGLKRTPEFKRAAEVIPLTSEKEISNFAAAIVDFIEGDSYNRMFLSSTWALADKTYDPSYPGPSLSVNSQMMHDPTLFVFAKFMDEKCKRQLSKKEVGAIYDAVPELRVHSLAIWSDYEKYSSRSFSLKIEFAKLKNTINSTTKDPIKTIEVNYSLKKIEREIDSLVKDQNNLKEELVEFAGKDALKT